MRFSQIQGLRIILRGIAQRCLRVFEFLEIAVLGAGDWR
jgi:hypothetical protein